MKYMKNGSSVKNTSKRDEITTQQKIINHWENEFEDILKQKQKRTMELFPIDKNLFTEYKRLVLSDNLSLYERLNNYNSFPSLNNSNILYDMQSINPNSDFILLNKQSMDSFPPNLLSNKLFDVKLVCQFSDGKMITKIGYLLYYYYYLDEKNAIQEGILMFDKIIENHINEVIFNFLSRNIKLFINCYFSNEPSANNRFIVYHRNEFDFLIKKEENQELYTNNNLIFNNI